jgi:YHS domain-containing protein
LDLANSQISDAGLANLAGLKNLTRLHLENTGVGDAGLAHLKGLTNLEYLNLYNTQVTDAGLANLTGLKNLKKLYLWQSKVTEAGAAELQKSLPEVAVNLGWKEPPPPKEEEKAAAAINATCPLSGKAINAEFVFEYKGQTIGFCCADCRGKFEKNPEEFIAKVAEFKAPAPEPAPEVKIVNAKCPLSGKPVNAKFTFTYKGATIGFCCENCLGQFSKEPDKFISKVTELNKQAKVDGPINKTCPLSGKAVNAEFVAAYQGQTIGFCCGDCCKKFEADPAAFIAKVPEFKAAATN